MTHLHSPHTVQFYDDEESAMATVAQFLALGLRDGDAIIVIATAGHRAAIEAGLVRYGLDPLRAATEGWYLALDAQETLNSFMGELPDPQRYEAVITKAIRSASAKSASGKVHAYGEMVALLCEQGAPEAAIALEALWNNLGTRLEFSLFCSYPMHVITQMSSNAVADIVASHSGVMTDGGVRRIVGRHT